MIGDSSVFGEISFSLHHGQCGRNKNRILFCLSSCSFCSGVTACATCCGRSLFRNHLGRSLFPHFSFPHYHRFRVTSRSDRRIKTPIAGYILLPRSLKHTMKSYFCSVDEQGLHKLTYISFYLFIIIRKFCPLFALEISILLSFVNVNQLLFKQVPKKPILVLFIYIYVQESPILLQDISFISIWEEYCRSFSFKSWNP